MEYARILEERLRRIIREVSGHTGSEIKKNLTGDLEEKFRTALKDHSENETAKFLSLLKKACEKI